MGCGPGRLVPAGAPMSSLRNSVNSESANKRFKPGQVDEVLPVNNAEVPDVIRQF